MEASGRRVVVTGANRGIGLELARQCAARGDTVFAGCRSPDDAEALGHVPSTTVLPLDVADEASVIAFATAVGGATDRVDLLLNNAGVNAAGLGGSADRSGVLDLDAALFLAQVEVNAVGPMLVTRALRERLRAAKRAAVVNVSSQLGSLARGAKPHRDIGYDASKAALNMVTTALASELGTDGVVTVAVHPGWVRTDMGGSEAPVSAEASARDMLETIDRLGASDNGHFLNRDGSLHPW